MVRLFGLACFALFLAALPAWTDEATDKAFSNIANGGIGVQHPKTDDKGRLISCVIVGRARISTVFGKSQGLIDAQDKAQRDAKARFAQWLGEKTSIYEKENGEAVVFMEGNEGNDKDAMTESGKRVEKTTKNFESIAQAQIRGLQFLHHEQNGAEKMMSVVLGWDAKTAKAIRGVRAANEDAPVTKLAKSKERDFNIKEGDAKKIGEDKKIGDKKFTSPDAKKFLP